MPGDKSKSNLWQRRNTYIPYRVAIPSLFIRFVLFLKVHVLENFVVLLRNVLILNLRPYFVLFSALMSEITLQQ